MSQIIHDRPEQLEQINAGLLLQGENAGLMQSPG